MDAMVVNMLRPWGRSVSKTSRPREKCCVLDAEQDKSLHNHSGDSE